MVTVLATCKSCSCD